MSNYPSHVGIDNRPPKTIINICTIIKLRRRKHLFKGTAIHAVLIMEVIHNKTCPVRLWFESTSPLLLGKDS
jgi:hypothetical protein